MGRESGVSMLVGRGELFGLLGPKGEVAPEGARHFALEGTGRVASVSWSSDGLLCAEAAESVPGGGSSLVARLDGAYDASEDAFDVTGEDATGEGSEAGDPRAAASAWRRMVAPMQEVGDR